MVEQSKVEQHKKFGTFIGVFTPSVLTILGLIMYLRFGWVVGNVGLWYTLAIVVLASSITFITGLSASAIATNMLVGAGGEYYMVSRSLGIEPGGAIGIPLYFCRTLSVTFYCFGLAEAIVMFWPADWGEVPENAIQFAAAGFIILITLLAGKSAELVLKAQIPILILVGLSLVAFFSGVITGPLQAPEVEANYETAPEGFWYVFAVFFPAVTGFTAGVGMSGDLQNPKKSIPRGTLGAVVVCLLVYLMIPVAIAVSENLTADELIDANSGVENWIKVSIFGGIIIIPAVLGAILSSAFGSILSGPRVLQALSNDGLAPEKFAQLSRTGQPTVATWITGGIALAAVLLGELNTVAQLVSVLFLTLYVAINLSAAIEVLVAEPSYRPQIRVPWYVSMLGAAGAIFVMFLISPLACLLALIIELGIYFYLRRKSLEQNWGDVGTGILLSIAKRALLSHSRRRSDPRNWRPQILLLTSNIRERLPLVKLAAAISEDKGVLTLCKFIHSENGFVTRDDLDQLQLEMQEELSDLGIDAFCEVQVAEDIHQASIDVAKAHGIAGLRSNTLMEGLSEIPEARIRQLEKLNELAAAGKNVIYTRFRPKPEVAALDQKISIWWGGRDKNADLMLLLGYLLQLNRDYSQLDVEIISLTTKEEDAERLKGFINNKLSEARIEADVQVLVTDQSVSSVIIEKSRTSRVTIIGLPVPESEGEQRIAEWMDDVSIENNLTMFVYNAGMANAIPKLLRE